MIVGVPREIKPDERRVGLEPAGARELVERGHAVLVERGAGLGARFHDGDYRAAGARIVGRNDVWSTAELVVKVKEPVDDEPRLVRHGQLLFAYLHLSAAVDLARRLCASGCTAIAYETVETSDGRLPLLAPMSEVAGKLATQAAAGSLLTTVGGRGVLMGGAIGVKEASVVVIGAGVVGTNAALVASGMGAGVTLFDRNLERLDALDSAVDRRVRLRYATSQAVEDAVRSADVVIGAVLLPGARAPRVVGRELVASMRPGSVVVDVAIDQGGCVETARPTSHSDPVYLVDDVLHYCVTNMPGAVPVTATSALCNATLPYIELLASHGADRALALKPELARGLNVRDGQIVHEAVAASLAASDAPMEHAVSSTSGGDHA